MARSYAKLYTSIWSIDSDFRCLSGDAQRLYMLLVSHPDLSPAGVAPLQPRKWARCARDTTERQLTKALAELTERRYVLVDEATEELLVRTFVIHDGGVRTPNIVKAIMRAIEHIESKPLRKAAERSLTDALAETIPKSSAKPLPEGLLEGSSE